MTEIFKKNNLYNSTEENFKKLLEVAFSKEICSGQPLDNPNLLQKMQEMTEDINEPTMHGNLYVPQLLNYCTEGIYDKVKDCIINCCDVNGIGPSGETALTCAININNVQIVELLLKSGASPNGLMDKMESTPLMDACNSGYTDIVRILLEYGANADIKSVTNNTALHYAACGGHFDCCQLILNNSSNPQVLIEEQNENGHTALMEAATSRFLETTKYLVDSGAQINAPSAEFKETALTLASYKGYSEILEYLLEAGADLEQKTDEMHSALMEASMEGHLEAVKVLLYYGAYVNMRSDSFESPLTLAACSGHADVAVYLIHYGADIEEVNDESYTPLMEAAREGHLETVAMLLALGAHINRITEETQETAMTLAACGGFYDIVLLLHRCGANIELGSSSPLMESSQEGHIEVVKALLKMGAKIDAKNSSGETSLHFAAENGHIEVCKYLLDHHADIHHVSEGGRTCLMKACRAGNLDVVNLLIDRGARVDQMTTTGDHNALSLACANGHCKVVEYLLQIGADPTTKLKDNCTVLIEASRAGHIDVIEILLRDNNRNKRLLSTTNDNNEHIYPIDSFNNIINDSQSYSNYAISTTSTRTKNIPQDLDDVKKLRDGTLGVDIEQPLTHGICDHISLSTISTEQHISSATEQLLPCSQSCFSDSVNNNSHVFSQSSILPTQFPDPPVNPPPCSLNHPENSLYTSLVEHSHLPLSMLHDDYDKLLQNMIDTNSPNLDEWVKCICPNFNDNIYVADSKVQNSTLSCVTTPQVLEEQTSQNNNFHRTIKKAKHSENYNNQIDLPIFKSNYIQNQFENNFVTEDFNNLELDYPESYKFHGCLVEGDDDSSVDHNSDGKYQRINEVDDMNEDLNPTCEELKKFQLRKNTEVNFKDAYSLKKNLSSTLNDTILSMSINDSCTSSTDSGVFSIDTSNGQTTADSLHNEYQTDVKRIFSSVTSTKANSFKPKISNPALSSTPLQKQVLQPRRRLQPRQRSPIPDRSLMSTWSLLCSEYNISPHQLKMKPKSDSPVLSKTTITDCRSDSTIHSIQESNIGYTNLNLSEKHHSTEENDQSSKQPYYKKSENMPLLPIFTFKEESKIKHENPAQDSTVKLIESSSNSTKNNNIVSTSTLKVPTSGTDDSVDKLVVVEAIKIEDNEDEENRQEDIDIEIPDSVHNFNLKSKCCKKTCCMKKLNVNVCTESSQESPLSLACSGGHIEVVKLLIDSGAKLEHRDKKSQTPLHVAVLSGHLEVTKLLLESGADIEAVVERTKDTALSIVCANGKLNLVEELVRRGANIEHRNLSDYTSLSLAASGGFVDIIKFLLKNNSDVNSRMNSKLGISPLMLAAMNGHYDAVKILLDNGADINAQIETNKNTALTLSCFQGRADVVSLLIDKKAYIEHRAKSGLTPLMEAASQGHVDVGRILINAGADVNSPPVLASRETALIIAAEKGHTDFVRLLIVHNATVDSRNKKGATPLWLAAHGGYIDIVKILIEAISDPNSADNRRITCLMAAFKKGYLLVVKELVKHVTQFPSEYDCVKYMKSIKNEDKDLIKRCDACKELILKTKERQEYEAAKNAKDLLKQVDEEKKAKEQKEMKQAKKREKKKAKKKAKVDDKDIEIVESKNKEIPENLILNPSKTPSPHIELISLNDNENIYPNYGLQVKSNKRPRTKLQPEKTTIIVELNKPEKNPCEIIITTSNEETLTTTLSETINSPALSLSSENIDYINNNNTKSNSWIQINSNKILNENRIEQIPTNWQKIGSNKKKIDIQVNKKDIGKVIGQGGSVVNAIRHITGAHIDIDSLANDLDERTVHLKGTLEAVTKAKGYIGDLVDGNITGNILIKESETFLSKSSTIQKASIDNLSLNTATDHDYSKTINMKGLQVVRQTERDNKSSHIKFGVPSSSSNNNLQYGFSKAVKGPDFASIAAGIVNTSQYPELSTQRIKYLNSESINNNLFNSSETNIDSYSLNQFLIMTTASSVNCQPLNSPCPSNYIDEPLEVNITLSQPSLSQNYISKSFPLAPGSERSLYLRTYNSTPENSPKTDYNSKNEITSSDSTVSDKDESGDTNNALPTIGSIIHNSWPSNDYGRSLQDHGCSCEPISKVNFDAMNCYPKLQCLNPKAESFSPSFTMNGDNNLYNLRPEDFCYNINGTLTLNPTANIFQPRQQTFCNNTVIPTINPLNSTLDHDSSKKTSNISYNRRVVSPPQEERLIRLQDHINMAINILLRTNGYDHNMAEAAFSSFMRSANLDLNTRLTAAEFTTLINNIINQSNSSSSSFLPQPPPTIGFIPQQSFSPYEENINRLLSSQNQSPFRLINQPLTTSQTHWPPIITNFASQSIWAPGSNNTTLLTPTTYFPNINQSLSAQTAFNSPISLPISNDLSTTYLPQTLPISYDNGFNGNLRLLDNVAVKSVLSHSSPIPDA